MGPIEVIETQNVIIKMQSRVIDDLFMQLAQYTTKEELENMKCLDNINKAAELRKSIDLDHL